MGKGHTERFRTTKSESSLRQIQCSILMNKTTKYLIGGTVVAAGLAMVVIAIRKNQQSNSFSLDSQGQASNPITRNYYGQSGMLSSEFPRGIRNNNPGNIKQTGSAWGGEIPQNLNTDGTFEQFTTFEHGVRAMIKLLTNHINNGYNTVSKLINKYAPSSENPTSNYISFVVKETGYDKDAGLLTAKATLKKLVQAMAKFENGHSFPVSDWQFEDGYKLL
jgi:hypothetical protein